MVRLASRPNTWKSSRLELDRGEARRLSDVLIMSILLEFIRSPAGGRPSLLLPPLFYSENRSREVVLVLVLLMNTRSILLVLSRLQKLRF
jgi:hypothetical protein